MSQVFAAGQFYQVKLFAGRRVTLGSPASTPEEAGKKQTPQTIQKKKVSISMENAFLGQGERNGFPII